MAISKEYIAGKYFNIVSAEKSWRVQHDGDNVCDFFESEEKLMTLYKVFEYPTRDECLAQMDVLRLHFEPAVETI